LFTVSVTVRGGGEASGEGTTKQDAEKAAAIALLEQLTQSRSAERDL
jgi:ribonuclease-3